MSRIDALLAELTLEEKVALCAGSDAWHTTPVPRLGIPRLKVTDGPNGARGDFFAGRKAAACFPCGSALAATFDLELVEQVGAALGEEALSKGAQVLLAPTVNLHRTPLAGRNFECYSEDPYLTGRIASAYIAGVQSVGVGACIKHFVCNDAEFERRTISSEVAERPLRELYLRPFEMAVRDVDPWAVMSSYNRINGVYASSQRALLRGVLKDEWGFAGCVISDWGAALETVANANGGTDLEMPGPTQTRGAALVAAVREGAVEEKRIDDAARRVLRMLERAGRFEDPSEAEEQVLDRPEHRALARRASAESMVLLKNEGGVLPLDARALRRIAVIGPNAELGQIMGGGSAFVVPHYQVHPLAAIRERVGPEVEVLHEPGCRIEKFAPELPRDALVPEPGAAEQGLLLEYWDNLEHAGERRYARIVHHTHGSFQRPVEGVDLARFSARYTAWFTPPESGTWEFGLASSGRSRLYVDGALAIDNWIQQRIVGGIFGEPAAGEVRASVPLRAGTPVAIRIDYQLASVRSWGWLRFGALPPGQDEALERAVQAAAAADAAVVVVGTNGEWETEGRDREGLALPGRQAELIERVCAVNPRTAVVINAGSPVGLDWIERAPAVLQAWFGGQEFGNALADVLFGAHNPSGRLPTTFPVRIEDAPSFTSDPGENGRVQYGEGLFIGYRWYDARAIAPRFPFGHGLSYTEFRYGPLHVDPRPRRGEPIRVSLEVTNGGARAGQEVVQLYVRPPRGRLARPPQQLEAFAKLWLQPGETRLVELVLDERSLAYWDPAQPGWVVAPGAYELWAGASSRDLRSRAAFQLAET
jgi:beta-glucosidase